MYQLDHQVAFVVRQLGPVHNVRGKVDLLNCLEGGFGFLVHLPDNRMLDGK